MARNKKKRTTHQQEHHAILKEGAKIFVTN